MADGGTESDDAVEVYAVTTRKGQVVAVNDSLHADRLAALAAVKAEIHAFVSAEAAVRHQIRDVKERRKLVSSLLTLTPIEAAFKTVGKLAKPEQKTYVECILLEVKCELSSEDDRIKALVEDSLEVFGEWKQFLGELADYDSDVDEEREGMLTLESSVTTALNANLDESTCLGGTADEGGALGYASCTAEDPCLLCRVARDSGGVCAFKRRSQVHWLRPYQAVIYALASRGAFRDVSVEGEKRDLLHACDEVADWDAADRSAICPPGFTVLFGTLADASKLSVRALKISLSCAMMMLNAKALDAAEHARARKDLARLEERVAGAREEQPGEVIDGDSGSEEADARVDDCASKAADLIQCDADCPRCARRPLGGNRPFAGRAARTIVRFAAPSAKGMGLFAMEHIQRGAFIGEYRGSPTTDSTVDYTYVARFKDGATIDAKRTLGVRVKYANHCCRSPNTELQEWLVDGAPRLGLFAIKAIAPNTELVYTYTDEELRFVCKCACCSEQA